MLVSRSCEYVSGNHEACIWQPEIQGCSGDEFMLFDVHEMWKEVQSEVGWTRGRGRQPSRDRVAGSVRGARELAGADEAFWCSSIISRRERAAHSHEQPKPPLRLTHVQPPVHVSRLAPCPSHLDAPIAPWPLANRESRPSIVRKNMKTSSTR